jgi:hypothetical protein
VLPLYTGNILRAYKNASYTLEAIKLERERDIKRIAGNFAKLKDIFFTKAVKETGPDKYLQQLRTFSNYK